MKLLFGILLFLLSLWGGFYVAIEVIPDGVWRDPPSVWWGFPACMTLILASIGGIVAGIHMAVTGTEL
jgi:hypothetical protein